MTGDDKSQYDDENRAVLGFSYGATSVLYVTIWQYKHIWNLHSLNFDTLWIY